MQNVRAVIHTETPKLPLFAGGEYTSRGGRGSGASGIVRKRSMLWAGNRKQRHEKQETNPQCRVQGTNSLGGGQGPQDVQQIAAEIEVHPTQLTQWKIQMIEGAFEVLKQSCGHHSQERAAQIWEERLERKIGQLVVEVDWLWVM